MLNKYILIYEIDDYDMGIQPHLIFTELTALEKEVNHLNKEYGNKFQILYCAEILNEIEFIPITIITELKIKK